MSIIYCLLIKVFVIRQAAPPQRHLPLGSGPQQPIQEINGYVNGLPRLPTESRVAQIAQQQAPPPQSNAPAPIGRILRPRSRVPNAGPQDPRVQQPRQPLEPSARSFMNDNFDDNINGKF